MQPSIGLKGRVKLTVLRDGEVIHETPWQKNLWLNQGLDRIASIPICEAFSVAVKGTGSTITTQDLTTDASTYSIPINATTLTRAAGTHVFTADDIGSVIRFSTTPFQEFKITDVTSDTTAEVYPPAPAAITTKKFILYRVYQTGLATEVGRTKTYSNTPNENTTTTVGQVRTFTRTFLFPIEDTLVEYVIADNTFSQSGTIITRVTGARDFTSADIGAKVTFIDSNTTATILSVSNTAHVVVDLPSDNAPQSIIVAAPNNALRETPATSNTYSRAGAVVTRAAGTRNFTVDDVGKIIHFIAGNVEAKITVFTNATTVTVDTAGTLAAQNIKLYGFTDYSEIGFANTMQRGSNLNIRVLLGSPVRTYVSTGLRASDQLKLAYQCTLTVEPNTVTPLNLTSSISDPGGGVSGMSSNKNGSYVIESFATSLVTSTGETDITFADLEPFYEGFAAFSLSGALSADALAPLSGKVRDNSTAYVPMVADPYNTGDYFKTFQAVFDLNTAINNNWRTLMIFDPDTKSAIFTFLFVLAQRKDGEHTFQIGFKKAWGRDLS